VVGNKHARIWSRSAVFRIFESELFEDLLLDRTSVREGTLNAGFSSYLFSSPDGAVGGLLEELNHVNALRQLQARAGDQGRQPVL